jgi:Lhr-like helicase
VAIAITSGKQGGNPIVAQVINQISLYDRDFLLWTEETTNLLKARDFDRVDLDNLIEEIEALGRSEKKELKSRLLTLLEHILKRLHVKMPREYNGWERTIREQRIQIELLLDDSPSLKTQWHEACDSLRDAFRRAWELALKKVSGDYPKVEFPSACPFATNIETLLNQNFWESSAKYSLPRVELDKAVAGDP